MRVFLLFAIFALCVSLFYPLPAKKLRILEFNRFHKEITFVSYPFPTHSDELMTVFRISILSWINVSKNSQVILFIDEKFDFNQLKIKSERIELISISDERIPDIFSKAKSLCKTKYICFIQPFVVVDKWWYDYSLNTIINIENETSVLTGYQYDVDYKIDTLKKVNDSSLLQSIKIALLESSVRCRLPTGSDYFIFPIINLKQSYIDTLPPYHFGGSYWDLFIIKTYSQKYNFFSMRNKAPVYSLRLKNQDHELIKENEKMYDYTNILKHYQIAENKMIGELNTLTNESKLYKQIPCESYREYPGF